MNVRRLCGALGAEITGVDLEKPLDEDTRSAILEAFTEDDRREGMTQSTNIFRVLIKTLLKAGIITNRTKHVYAQWVDMEELAAEDDEVVGVDVAEAGITELREINRNRKRVGRNFRRA